MMTNQSFNNGCMHFDTIFIYAGILSESIFCIVNDFNLIVLIHSVITVTVK